MKRGILYTFVYILITIVSAVGTIAMSALLPSSGSFGISSSGSLSSIESTAGEKVLGNMMSMGNTAVNADIELLKTSDVNSRAITAPSDSQISDTIRINFAGNINIAELENIKMDGRLKVLLEGNEINLDIAFFENVLYVSNETLNVKMEAVSLAKIMEIMPLFGIDIQIDLDMSSLDINSLMENFANMTESTMSNGDKSLGLTLMEGMTIYFVTDSEYNVKGVVANDIAVPGYTISLATSLGATEEELVAPEETETEKFVDVTKTLNVVDSISEIIENEKLHLDITANIDSDSEDIAVVGDVDIDFSQELSVYVDMDLIVQGATNKLQLGYVGSNIYVTLNNINFVLFEETIEETIDVVIDHMDLSMIEEIILKKYIKNLPKNGFGITSNIDLSTVDIDNLLAVSKGEDHVVSITLNGEAMNMDSDIKISIVLDENDQFDELILHDVEVSGTIVDANISYSNEVNIPTLDVANYHDMSYLPDFVDAIITTIENIEENQNIGVIISDEVVIEGVTVALEGNLNINFADTTKVYLDLVATACNKSFNINMYYVDGYIYLSIDGIKAKFTANDILAVVTVLEKHMGASFADLTMTAIEESIATSDILENITSNNIAITDSVIKSLSIQKGLFVVELQGDVIGLENSVQISLGYSDDIDFVGVAIPDLPLDFTIVVTGGVAVPTLIEEEYSSLKYLSNLVDASLNTYQRIVENKTLAVELDILATIDNNTIPVNAVLVYSDGVVYMTAEVSYNNSKLELEAYILQDIIYLDIQGLRVKTTIAGVKDLVALLGNSVDPTILSVALAPLYAIDIDLSMVDLSLLNNFSIGETASSITIDSKYLNLTEDLTIAINYIDTIQSISIPSIAMENTSVSILATISSGYNIPSVAEDSYSDISYISRLVNAISNTYNYLYENRKVAFTINANIASDIDVLGTIYIDLSKVDFESVDISRVSAYAMMTITTDTTYTIEVRLEDGFAYASYKGLNLKMKISSIQDMIDLVQDLIPENTTNVDMTDITDSLGNSILKEVISGDYSHLSLSLVKNIVMSQNATYVTIDKSTFGLDKDFRLIMQYGDKISALGVLNATQDGKSTSVNIGLNYVFTPSPIQQYKYFDISGMPKLANSVINTGKDISITKAIAINLNELYMTIESTIVEVSGDMYIDFSSVVTDGETEIDYTKLSGYIDLDISIDGGSAENISIYLEGGSLFVSYNSLSLSISISEISGLADLVVEFQKLHNKVNTVNPMPIKEIDVADVVTTLMTSVDIESMLDIEPNNIDFGIIKYLNISDTLANIVLDKSRLGIYTDLDIAVAYAENITGIQIAGSDFLANIGIGYGKINYVIPYSEYTNLDNLDDALASTLITATDVVDNEHIAFGLSANITYTEFTKNAGKVITKETITKVNLLDTSYAKFDWSQAYEIHGNTREFVLERMGIYARFNTIVETTTYPYIDGVRDEAAMTTITDNHDIEITYLNNVVYIRFDSMYAYIPGETIGNIINSIAGIAGLSVSTDSLSTLMGMISSSMDPSMMDNISIDMLKSFAITDNSLSLLLDMSSQGFGLDTLDLDMYYDENGLTDLYITDFNLSNIYVSTLNIDIDTFTAIEAVDTTGYMCLAGIEDLLDSINNTIQFTDYEIDGDVKLQLNILNINFDIPVNFKLKLTDNGPEAKIVLGPIPVITGVNDDVPYIAGNSVNLSGNPGEDRVLTLYLKENMIYIHRTEIIPTAVVKDRVYEKRTKVHIETFMNDPFYYLLEYGMGFSGTIMSAINTSLNKERKEPMDYSNILLGFAKDGNRYELVLNLEELAEDEKMDTITVGIITTLFNGKPVVDVITLDIVMPVADGVIITIETQNLTIVNKGKAIDFTQDMYSYINTYGKTKEGAEWDAYNGQWELSSQRKFVLSFDTRCDIVANSIEAPAGSRIDLPTLQGYYVDTETERIYYEFAGWYDTITYDNQFTAKEMPRASKTLYAKWNTHVEKYITINFEEMGGSDIQNMKVLENSRLNLPTYSDLRIVETADRIETWQFEYWYQIVDGVEVPFEREFAPNSDITLYAKWDSVNVAETHAVTVYDNGEYVTTKRFFAGDTVSFTGAKFNDNTKYLYNGEVFDMVMPDYDINIDIKNVYTITVKYKLLNPYRDAVDIVYSGYQGEAIMALPSQEDGYYDDGTQISRDVYDFKGWLYNGSTTAFSTIPNMNSTIVADWEEDTLYYYEVSFNVSWVKPGSWQDNNSRLFGKIYHVQSATVPSASFRLLEGTKLDLTNYKATCTYDYEGSWVRYRYHFDVAYWSDQKSGQLYYNNGAFKNDDYTPNTPYEIKDDVTFYAVWKMYDSYKV